MRYIQTEPSGPRSRWNGIGFHIDNRQETFDTETFAIIEAIHLLASRQQTGQVFTIFTDSQAAMTRIESVARGAGQDMAIEIIHLTSEIYEQGNTLTVRWVPGRRGVSGNEIAGVYAKEAAEEKTSDNQNQKARERISLAHLKRKAAKKAIKQRRNHILKLDRGQWAFDPQCLTPSRKSGQVSGRPTRPAGSVSPSRDMRRSPPPLKTNVNG